MGIYGDHKKQRQNMHHSPSYFHCLPLSFFLLSFNYLKHIIPITTQTLSILSLTLKFEILPRSLHIPAKNNPPYSKSSSILKHSSRYVVKMFKFMHETN